MLNTKALTLMASVPESQMVLQPEVAKVARRGGGTCTRAAGAHAGRLSPVRAPYGNGDGHTHLHALAP